MNIIKFLFLVAIVGHILCGICDCLITYVPGGKKFDIKQMSDNSKMAEVFKDMPLRNITASMILGVAAIFMVFGGYYGIYLWMREYSSTSSILILIGAALFATFGVAHHVFCGVAEWFYVRFGLTEDALRGVIEFFKSTASTMIICYIGMALAGVALFISVVTGTTSLPAWACIFNAIPLTLVFTPLRIGGTGNWCGAIMFAALLILC